MEKPAKHTVLRRKAQAVRAAHDAREMSPARALRLAIERCAARDLGFMLSVTGVEPTTALADALAADLPEPALILLLDGAGGRPGAMVLDAQMTAALVEAQTMGRVMARPSEPRAPTRTDAAIAQPLVQGVLSRLVDLLAEAGDWAQGFEFGAMVDSARALALALGTGEHRVMRVGCGLGADREGEIVLALPQPEPEPSPEDTAPDESDMPGARPLRDRLLNAPARLEAVLCRISLPLSQVQGLRVGETLDLPANAVHSTVLETAPGRVVARATLGQMSGQRALRLQGDTARAGPVPPAPDGAQGDEGRAGDAADTGMRSPPEDTAPPSKPSPLGQRVDPAAGLPDLSEFGIEDAPDDDTGEPDAATLIGMNLE